MNYDYRYEPMFGIYADWWFSMTNRTWPFGIYKYRVFFAQRANFVVIVMYAQHATVIDRDAGSEEKWIGIMLDMNKISNETVKSGKIQCIVRIIYRCLH